MSQHNIDVVRRMFAAYQERDTEAVLETADTEVELRPAVIGGPEGTVYRGHDGIRAFYADIDATWEEFSVEVNDFRDFGETVVVLGRSRLVARDGMTLDTDAGWVFAMRDGTIARFDRFLSHEAALAAAGA